MIRIPQLVRTQCRHDLRRPLVHVQQVLSRSRGSVAAKSRHLLPPHPHHKATPPKRRDGQNVAEFRINAEDIPEYFSRNALTWISQFQHQIRDRLIRFGIPKDALKPLLKTYCACMESGRVFQDLQYSHDQLSRLAYDITVNGSRSMDRYFTRILFEWVVLPGGQAALEPKVPTEILSRMQTLFRAADLSTSSWTFTTPRRSQPRKFIMHVGPTNSGKTHNALRALAAAKRGMYAGPLRLLAYEIFDRLNKGQIIPLGVEPSPAAEPDPQSNIDVGEGSGKGKDVAVTKTGDPRYARLCNMVTGEEHKIVAVNAPLLSCTVEMTPFSIYFDVAVIDEIQLIADPQRGGAWTNAVLGLNAAEIHLCGEEAAVPLIEALVRDLGDTIEVNRYERLTPLVVAEKSLEGDLSRVKKGDCVVTFSRSGLFGLKHSIEDATKIRCALAYGRLPPEIRSEQAALFNDPKSDYNVLVGSDAVGMGLNLKIKRVIFETVSKFDGSNGMRPMSASQIKQIAGRAGRFGLHEKDAVGVVTTLHPTDLDLVREALDAPPEPLRYARLTATLESFTNIVQALPWEASNMTVAEVYIYVSRMSPLFEFQSIHELEQGCEFIDSFIDCLTLPARLLTQNAPCPWRDQLAAAGARAMMEIYRDKLRVPVEEVLHRARLLKGLNKAFAMMETRGAPLTEKEVVVMLSQLETVHKVVVLYLWFSYRYVVAFPDQKKGFQLRNITELAMDWCLEVLHQMQRKVKNPAGEARKAVLLRRPEGGAAPASQVEETADWRTEIFNPKADGTFIHHVVR